MAFYISVDHHKLGVLDMLIRSTDENVEIDYYALATLKQLAKKEAMKREINLSSTTLAVTGSRSLPARRLHTSWRNGVSDSGGTRRQPAMRRQ